MYEQSFSNNSKPLFFDEENLTIFLIEYEFKYMHLKGIHDCAKKYLFHWNPNRMSCRPFVYCPDRAAGVVADLSRQKLCMFRSEECDNGTMIVRSMFIMDCSSRNRTGKVAVKIVDKRHCSMKIMYYHDLKMLLSVITSGICRSQINSYSLLRPRIDRQFSKGNVLHRFKA